MTTRNQNRLGDEGGEHIVACQLTSRSHLGQNWTLNRALSG
jgi:hypothetical protein